MTGGALGLRVREAVEAVNIAGLCDPGKKNWYAADAADAIASAPKLGVSPDDVAAALRRWDSKGLRLRALSGRPEGLPVRSIYFRVIS